MAQVLLSFGPRCVIGNVPPALSHFQSVFIQGHVTRRRDQGHVCSLSAPPPFLPHHRAQRPPHHSPSLPGNRSEAMFPLWSIFSPIRHPCFLPVHLLARKNLTEGRECSGKIFISFLNKGKQYIHKVRVLNFLS